MNPRATDSNTDIDIRPATGDDRAWIAAQTIESWGAETIVSRGVVCLVTDLPALVAEIDRERVGLLTYRLGDDDCEITTLNAYRPRRGVGSALIAAVRGIAGSRRLWLVTTNDNLDALRFYQRRGFVLTAMHANAIEQSRRIKPQIPRVGCFGIPIRDEIELTFVD